MKKLYFIILLALLITSCETREDINMRRNTSPEIYVGMNEEEIMKLLKKVLSKKIEIISFFA